MSDTAHDRTEQPTCGACGGSVVAGEQLCRRCLRTLQLRLEDIPPLVHELETTISRQGRGGNVSGGHRKKGDEQPLPYNAHAARKRAQINVLAEWADQITLGDARVRAVAPVPIVGDPTSDAAWIWEPAAGSLLRTGQRPGTHSDTRRAADAVDVMLANVTWFRRDPQSLAAFDAIHTVRDRLRSVIDRVPERVYAGPCRAEVPIDVAASDLADGIIRLTADGRCTLPLHREWGKDEIVCDGHGDPAQQHLPAKQRTGCGAHHPAPDRAAFQLASVEDALLPLRLVWESLYILLPGCDVPWDTVKRWPNPTKKTIGTRPDGTPATRTVPPRLYPKATIDGVDLFRGGDILELARDDQPRRGARRRRTRKDRTT